MPEKLNPCPACGEKNVVTRQACDHFFVKCPHCCMSGPIHDITVFAEAAWNNLPRAPHITPNDADCKGCPERQNQGLVWSAKPPTVPGWYWYTQSDFSRPRIVQLMYRGLDTDRLTASFAGNEEDEWVEDMVGRWAGPIPIPEELVS